jgi:hypothetical protein
VERWPYQRYKKQSRSCAVFGFPFENNQLRFVVATVKKKCKANETDPRKNAVQTGGAARQGWWRGVVSAA